MDRQFFSGNTVEQAVMAAARHYGLEPHRISYRLRDKKHGFLNIRRRIVIEVDPSAPETTQEAQQMDLGPVDGEAVTGRMQMDTGPGKGSAPSSDERPDLERQGLEKQSFDKQSFETERGDSWRGVDLSTGSSVDTEPGALGEALGEIVGLVNPELEFAIEEDEEGAFALEIFGQGSEELRSSEGRALDSIQHLVPRMARGFIGHNPMCRVDSQGFRAAREQGLRDIARRGAKEVAETQKEQVLEPMNPAERRVVHLTLADDSAVQTESVGDGFIKRVRIFPS